MMNDIVKIPVTLVAAVTHDGGLGHSGRLLYHISADMETFQGPYNGTSAYNGPQDV